MKKLILSIAVVTAILTLLFFSVSLPVASADNGLHTGYEQGKGHEIGNGLGHDNHGCTSDCLICGGNPCVPPCPGV